MIREEDEEGENSIMRERKERSPMGSSGSESVDREEKEGREKGGDKKKESHAL